RLAADRANDRFGRSARVSAFGGKSGNLMFAPSFSGLATLALQGATIVIQQPRGRLGANTGPHPRQCAMARHTITFGVRSGSDSIIRRCRLRCPVCPKADTTGRSMNTRPNPPLVPTLQLLGGSSILGWDPVQRPVRCPSGTLRALTKLLTRRSFYRLDIV